MRRVGNPLPTDVRVTPLVDGVRYTLPRERLGFGGVIGLLLMAAFWNGITWGVYYGFTHSLWGSGGWWWLALAGITVFFVPHMAIGVALLAMIPLGLFGREHIEVTTGRVGTLYTLGPLRFRRGGPTTSLRTLTVGPPKADLRGKLLKKPAAGDDADKLAITAEFADAKPISFARGRSRELLVPLAEAVRAEVGRLAPRGLIGPDGPTVEVTESAVEPPQAPEAPPPQPTDSTILVEPQPDGVTLRILPGSVWKGSHGLVVFGLIWCTFMAVFTGLALFADAKPEDRDDLWIFALMIPLFWAIGLGILGAGINMARTRWVIDVIDGAALLVTRQNLLGLKQREWTVDLLKSVRVGASGTEVNEKPLMQLQIIPREGKPYGMLTGRSVDELEWLAATLRYRLKLPA